MTKQYHEPRDQITQDIGDTSMLIQLLMGTETRIRTFEQMCYIRLMHLVLASYNKRQTSMAGVGL